MQRYLLRRLILFIPTLLAVSLIVFGLMRIVPGDVAYLILAGPEGENPHITAEELAEVRERLGLNDPLVIQYAVWMRGLVTLDAGDSFTSNQPVSDEVFRRLIRVTVPLTLYTLVFSVVLAIPSGIMQAVKNDTIIDYGLRLFTISGVAAPSFVTGVVLLLFTVWFFRWIPPLEYVPMWVDPWKNFQQLFLPALALGHTASASLARMTRSSLLEVLRQDYVRTAHAKGLRPRYVIVRHAFRNAMLPVVTMLGILIGNLLSGTVITETLFNLPGVGRTIVTAITHRDYPTVQFVTMLFAIIYLGVNLLVDVLYGYLDPRIRYD